MKFLVLFTFLACTAIQSYAQLNPDKAFYLQKAEKYRRMKNTGKALTLTGTILTVVGMVTLMNSTSTTTYYGGTTQTSSSGNQAGGAIAYLVGAASVGAGVPLWIVGGVNHGKYTRKFQSVSGKLILTPQTTGLTLTYRF